MAADDAVIQNFLFYKVGSFFGVMGFLWYFRSTVKHYTTKRVFAWVLHRVANRLNKALKKEKTELFQHMHQYKEKVNRDLTVLEVGAGSAANLKFFPYNTKLVCLDPNPHFKGYIINNVKKTDTVVSLEIVQGCAEEMPLEDNHFDVVICTMVLCTVTDPVKSLQEIKRVLKPGGKFLFLEHVGAAEKTWTRLFQRLVAPLWVCLGDGCHTCRDTANTIRATEFSVENIENFSPRKMPFWVRPCILGTATK